MVIYKSTLQRPLLAALLIIMGVMGRIFLCNFLPALPRYSFTLNGITQPVFMADMFFIVAAIALLSGLLLGGYYTLLVPLGVLFLTDLYYGNNSIFLFTWSGFVLLGLLGYSAKKRLPLTVKSILPVMGLGIGGVLLYDLWTNFGCWLMWYPATLDGLLYCYILALPFTAWHLLSTLLALPLLYFVVVAIKTMKGTLYRITITPLEKYVTLSASSILIITSLLLVL